MNPQGPRSLITCVAGVNNHLSRVAKLYGRQTAAQEAAAALQAGLEAETLERIFEEGLHEFLSRFIRQTADVAGLVVETYLSGDMR